MSNYPKKFISQEGIDWIQNEAKQGDVLTGVVKNIKPFGAFVEMENGIIGLLHIEDISVSRIKSPEERFQIGQKINVMVKCVDKDLNRIELTYKELLGTWDENVVSYEEGSKVKGIVREVEKKGNGIFIELKPNLVGLAEFKEGYEYGQTVDVFIRRIIKDKKKIKLLII